MHLDSAWSPVSLINTEISKLKYCLLYVFTISLNTCVNFPFLTTLSKMIMNVVKAADCYGLHSVSLGEGANTFMRMGCLQAQTLRGKTRQSSLNNHYLCAI